MQLSLFLLELLELALHLSHQDNIIHFGMFFDFLCEFVELGCEVFLLTYYFVIFLGELLELDLEFEYAVFEGLVFGFIVLAAHFVFLELT